MPPDGGAVRARRAAARARPLAGGPVGRAPRRGRVRAPGDRRQARAAGARAVRRGRAAAGAGGAGGRAGRHRDRVRAPDDAARPASALRASRWRAAACRSAFDPPRRPVRRARSWWRRSTTCCGSSCTCSSSTAACSRAAGAGGARQRARRAFLYPFLAEQEDDLEAVVADVRGSVLMKAAETAALRVQTLTDDADVLAAAAADAARGVRGRRAAARARQRRLGHRRDGRGRRLPRAGGPPRRARPDRGRRDPHRDRQRHRRRGDVRAPGDRARPPGRRAARALHERHARPT